MEDTCWERKEPASVFEEFADDAVSLLRMLDQKLKSLQIKTGDHTADIRFMEWLRNESEYFLAVFFAASEIADTDTGPLRMFIISDHFRINNVVDGLRAADMRIFIPKITDYEMLDAECKDEEGSAARALLSGELLVGGRDRREMEKAIRFAKEAQKIFDGGRLSEDLGFLIAVDVSSTVYHGQEGPVEIAESDMQRLALKMMKKRKVEPHVRKKLIPSIKKALVL